MKTETRHRHRMKATRPKMSPPFPRRVTEGGQGGRCVYDLIIIGAGNLGLWTAHELARRGFGRIAVCERQWAGFGATTRSAGVVRQQGGSETAIKLGKWSRELYLRLGDEIGLDSGFTETGYYVLAETEEEK